MHNRKLPTTSGCWPTSASAFQFDPKPVRAALCALWILTTASRAAYAASTAALGYLPGDNYSSATGVSADGSVIVGASANQAFRWTAGSGLIGLGYLPAATNSSAVAVSGDGSVVVGTSGNQAFRWTAASGMVRLGS